MSILSKPYFHDEAAAYEHLEGVLWPTGPYCPHCGALDRLSKIKPNPEKRVRYGLYKCGHCKKQFTVKIGTVFEASNVPLHKWLQAVYLLTCSKKGVSSHQLHRILEVTYKTAWFMSHRIREAMRSGALDPLGGAGKVVEADETFIGHRKGFPMRRGSAHKMKVLSLLERGGNMRSMRMDAITRPDIEKAVAANVNRESRLMTDEAAYYRSVGATFAEHGTVNHASDEWARGDVHVNTLEGYFSIFKRGMKGVYQHCGEQHLHRYLAEFDFRYNHRIAAGFDDSERAHIALASARGRRLTYRRTHWGRGTARGGEQ